MCKLIKLYSSLERPYFDYSFTAIGVESLNRLLNEMYSSNSISGECLLVLSHSRGKLYIGLDSLVGWSCKCKFGDVPGAKTMHTSG